jgi:cephalosporin-C deacetylase-like acetyl esterase
MASTKGLQGNSNVQGGGVAAASPATEQRLYEKLNLVTYVCDFGNVVINHLRKKQFKI